MLSQATKVLPGRCQTLARLQSSSQVEPLLFKQKRCKQTISGKIVDKRCEQKPRKSRRLVTATGMVVVGTTVAMIAAKHNEDFRQWTGDNLPALDNLVKFVYEEEETYLEFLAKIHKQLTEWLKKALYDIFRGATESGGPKKGIVSFEGCEESQTPYKPPESAFLVKKDDKQDVKEEKPGDEVAKHLKELKELEDKVGRAAQDTIQSYHAAICALREKFNLIDNLDQLISKHDCKIWDKLQKNMQDEKKFMEKAKANLTIVESTAETLRSQLDGNSNLSENVKTRARNNLITMMGDVHKAKENMDKETDRTTLAKRSWDKVRQARMHFAEELETLFPNVWLNDEKLNLPLDSLDPFVQTVLNNIVFLDKELAKLQTIRESEVNSAIERFRSSGDPEGLVTAAVNIEGGKEKRLQQEGMQKALLTHQARCEKTARTQMKQQAEVYSDLKAEALSMKEREVERKLQQQLEERLAQARAQHKIEIAKMVGRIQGAKEAIAQRGDKDKFQQERQRFWSAVQRLLSAVEPIGLARNTEPKPLKNEITNVSKAAPDGDELVGNVLKSIPAQAVERGVQGQARLQERYLTVEQEARKVAGVPSGPVTLLQLILARVQSALYVDECIPQPELDNEPVDMTVLNNYEILYRARYYVDRGQLDQAVRYLHLLKGPSHRIASDWVQDVLVYLETKQAAQVLLAYASYASLQA